MTLGEIIDTLEQMPTDVPVKYSDGNIPGSFESWRGIYAVLTLTPDGDGITAGELLKMAIKADGGTFEGYKGGEYIMNRKTPVWADDYGYCSGYGITGCKVSNDEVILIRTKIPFEYRD